jgi:hypothetical protein
MTHLSDDVLKTIRNVLDSTEIVLAVIGHEWPHIRDGQRTGRLDNPEGLVRIEHPEGDRKGFQTNLRQTGRVRTRRGAIE